MRNLFLLLLEVLLVLGAILVLARDVKFIHSTGAVGVGRGTSSIVWLIIRYRAEATYEFKTNYALYILYEAYY